MGFSLPNEAPTSRENFHYATAARYFARLSDEFLHTYFLLGITQVAHYGRYFIMAQCLELSFKASLANRSIPITYGKHNLEYLEKQLVQHGDVEFEEIRPDATTEELVGPICRPNFFANTARASLVRLLVTFDRRAEGTP
ncbi:MAG: hypothetical protein DMF32_09645 [Verrucomicrobia bacterium]|nr:MAG: hypothetical protein DMF32_09645 [Verrucomicrobiota bacterium]